MIKDPILIVVPLVLAITASTLAASYQPYVRLRYYVCKADTAQLLNSV